MQNELFSPLGTENSGSPSAAGFWFIDHLLSQGQRLCLVKAVLDLAQLGIQETLWRDWVTSMCFGTSSDAGILGGQTPSMFGPLNSGI